MTPVGKKSTARLHSKIKHSITPSLNSLKEIKFSVASCYCVSRELKKIDGERTSMKITAANTIRIPVQATDCTILQSVRAACKVAEVKNEWSCNLFPHTHSWCGLAQIYLHSIFLLITINIVNLKSSLPKVLQFKARDLSSLPKLSLLILMLPSQFSQT